MPADIVNFPFFSVTQDQIARPAVILYIKPVTDIFPITIDRKRPVMKRFDDHQRNQLFRQMIWSIVVGTTANCNRKSIRSVIGLYQKICRCLGCTVRTARMDRRLFCKKQIRPFKRKIPIHLIRRNLMITPDSIFPARIHQHCRSLYIGIQKDFRIFNRPVHMTFRCKVNYYIRVFFLKQPVYSHPIRHRCFHKTERWIFHCYFQG